MNTDITRLSVNLNKETAEALKDITKDQSISATEAIRRAISVYAYLLEEEDKGNEILVAHQDGKWIDQLQPRD